MIVPPKQDNCITEHITNCEHLQTVLLPDGSKGRERERENQVDSKSQNRVNIAKKLSKEIIENLK